MNIGFYLTMEGGNPLYYLLADILVRSIRKTMPTVPITQFTNLNSPSVVGIDNVVRMSDRPLSVMRATQFAAVSGDWVFVDTDVVFQESVEHVFADPFDVALSDRNWPHAPVPKAFSAAMPHNVGVVFSRSKTFWTDVLAAVHADQGDKSWYGDQKAICDVVAGGKYHVKILPGMVYNYPPFDTQDRALGAKVVHCKGNRKDWMMQRFYRETGVCA